MLSRTDINMGDVLIFEIEEHKNIYVVINNEVLYRISYYNSITGRNPYNMKIPKTMKVNSTAIGVSGNWKKI